MDFSVTRRFRIENCKSSRIATIHSIAMRASRENPRVIFFGGSNYGINALEATSAFLKANGTDLLGVVTDPTKSSKIFGAPQGATMSDVGKRALELGLQVFQPDSLKDMMNERGTDEDRKTAGFLRASDFDLIVASAYGKKIPQAVLDLPKDGAINLHPSILPAYRGAAPIHWAIANGDQYTGVTTLLMNAEFDRGRILLQREYQIGENEDTPHLRRSLRKLGAELITETLSLWQKDALHPREQLNAGASLAPKVTRQDGLLDWFWPAEKIRNRVRAMRPWPGTRTFFDGKELKVYKASVNEQPVRQGSLKPGTVHWIDAKGVSVVAGDYRSVCLEGLALPSETTLKFGDVLKAMEIRIGCEFNGTGITAAQDDETAEAEV